ncbi:MAG: DUF4058 family protein [Caldilineaceae bacterium]
MSYPFPGMNPWLENPQLWRNVHVSLMNAIRDALAPQLEPRYFVDVETHTYVARLPDAPIMMRYPDVAVLDLGGPGVAVAPTTTLATPLVVDLPPRETIEEPYLEIRLVPDGEVVTVIELLSHTNKRAGAERKSYLEKRELFLNADIHFIEIDLLRAWEPMPYTEKATNYHYHVFMHRHDEPHKAYLYCWNVREPIPVFPLPLQPGDQEPPIDLGALLQEVYDRARYKLIIDYAQSPTPALSKTDAIWAAQCLAEARKQ